MTANGPSSALVCDAQLRAAFEGGARRVALRGAHGSHLGLILARLARWRPLLIVTADGDAAAELRQVMRFFLPPRDDLLPLELPAVMGLPAVASSPYAEISFDRESMLERMSALCRLVRLGDRGPLVCSLAALRRRTLQPTSFQALCSRVAVGDEIERDSLAGRLTAAGYARYQVVDDPGTFAVRGGIVDLYPPVYHYPVRIELFGDEIESIRLFEPESQRTLRRIDGVEIFPVRETLRVGDVDLRRRLLALADSLEHPTRVTRSLLEELDSGKEFLGIEAFTPAFHDRLAPAWEHMADDALWVIVDPPSVLEAAEREDRSTDEAYAARQAAGRLAFAPHEFFVSRRELAGQIAQRECLTIDLSGEPSEAQRVIEARSARDNAELVAELKRARAERGAPVLEAFSARLRGWRQQRRPVVLAAGPADRQRRLAGLLDEYGVSFVQRGAPGTPRLLADDEPIEGVLLQAGELPRGVQLDEGLVLVSHEEIFGRKVVRPAPRRTVGARVGDLRQLSEGDHVVHVLHGIGTYRGLEQLTVDDVPADFLLIEYARGDRLYLPVHRLSQVAKYVADESAPVLDRLGGTTWLRKTRKVRAEVRKLGEELLQLYAQRAALGGHAYPAPDATFAEFEAAFPYTETPDQQQAISDVLGDLTSDRPMDRLVCGDVGFGKTEVALRAAFVVAMNGRQVALLAPTTVLVEQHYRSFSERMAPYPLRVEHVSRFRRPRELRGVTGDLAAGRVDVVIGTHRLLSGDVSFADLGLVVIDEEQRFGVRHKERMKQLRTQVDVLTLTATPIPRTLQLSMVGLREISVIATPPQERLAVRTLVSRFDEHLVAEALERELARGGQAFFVHNEVQTIERWAAQLAALVPRARIAVGHGQMDARRLERVMIDFVDGRYDVLVCSTIIEAGLDIPNVNTMFVNRAHRFGLSQLYQLRGRIGRSRRRAYCYLLVPGIERIRGQARKRLEALQRFSELGSGFSVASYDLELRGAGDLLGPRQSGHIAAVGFETYARVLEEAVAELKGEPIAREADPDLNVRVAAFIPDDYVEDTGQRLELYKRLSDACQDEQLVLDIIAEMRDRYGPLPEEVEHLAQLMIVKGLATRLVASALELSETRLTLTLSEDTPLAGDRAVALVQADARYSLSPPSRLSRRLDRDERRAPLVSAKQILLELIRHAIESP